MSLSRPAILELLEPEARFVPDELRDWWVNCLRTHTRHYAAVLSRLQAHEVRGSILEVGAVPGHLTVLLKSQGFDVQSIDLAPDRLNDLWAQHAIKVMKVDIERERLPFDDTTFRCVLFTEVLEHLRVQPIFALRETARVLQPGGRLILSLPNITLRDRIRFLFGNDYQGDIIAEFDKLERIGHMGHFRLYSIDEVRRLLEHVGYEKITWKREGRPVGRWMWRVLFPWKDAFRQHVYFEARRAENVG